MVSTASLTQINGKQQIIKKNIFGTIQYFCTLTLLIKCAKYKYTASCINTTNKKCQFLKRKLKIRMTRKQKMEKNQAIYIIKKNYY